MFYIWLSTLLIPHKFNKRFQSIVIIIFLHCLYILIFFVHKVYNYYLFSHTIFGNHLLLYFIQNSTCVIYLIVFNCIEYGLNKEIIDYVVYLYVIYLCIKAYIFLNMTRSSNVYSFFAWKGVLDFISNKVKVINFNTDTIIII